MRVVVISEDGKQTAVFEFPNNGTVGFSIFSDDERQLFMGVIHGDGIMIKKGYQNTGEIQVETDGTSLITIS